MSEFRVTDEGKIRGGVKILSPEGEDISTKVRSFEYRHAVGELPVLTLEIIGAEIDVTALEATYRQYAATGK